MTSFVVPGGVRCSLTETLRADILSEVGAVSRSFVDTENTLMDNFGALERMEGLGRLRTSLARDLGIVGPCGRASNIPYDVRQNALSEPYVTSNWQPVHRENGDVLSRVQVKVEEVHESFKVIHHVFENLVIESSSPKEDIFNQSAIPVNKCGVGIVESHRGELIHSVFTDKNGQISRYAIKDPSTNNWPGLAHAIRGEQVTDFPLCNKSFGLSYSGNDL